MKEFSVKSEGKVYTFKYPQRINEVSTTWLTAVSEGVEVSPNHCLIALFYRDSIANVVMTYKQKKKSLQASVTPVFVKAGATDVDYIKTIPCGSKLLIGSSELMNAHHVVIPYNTLSINKLTTLLDDDNRASQRALNDNFTCYFVEFKIVDNYTIQANYVDSKVVPDTFMSVEDDVEE